MSRGGNDYQSTSPPLLALTRGKQKRDILLEIAVAIIIIIITNAITKTIKFKKSADSQCYLGSYRVQRVQNRKSSRSSYSRLKLTSVSRKFWKIIILILIMVILIILIIIMVIIISPPFAAHFRSQLVKTRSHQHQERKEEDL